MADDFSTKLGGKKLSALRVVDLKLELEKRGLSKCGSKKELTDRLRQQLQLEKMHEETTSNEDCVPKLALDDATGQNEFVKQYLAEQQKIYAKQKEARRQVELGAQKTDNTEVGEESLCSKEINITVANKEDTDDEHNEQQKNLNPIHERDHVDFCEDNKVIASLPNEDLLTSEVPIEHQEKSAESGCPGPPEEQINTTMEPTAYSMIEYSLADIQLPDSPGKSKINENQNEEECTDEHPKESIAENSKNIDVEKVKEAHSNKSAKSGSYGTSKIEMKHTGVHIKIEMPKAENHITHDKQVDKSHHRTSKNRKEGTLISKHNKKETNEINEKPLIKSELSTEKAEETSNKEEKLKDISVEVVIQNMEKNGLPQPTEINEEKPLSTPERMNTDEIPEVESEKKLPCSVGENKSSENDPAECSENAENKISNRSEAVSVIAEDISTEHYDAKIKVKDETESDKKEKLQILLEDKNDGKQNEVAPTTNINKPEGKETVKVRKFSTSSHSSRSYSNDSSSSDSSPERKSAHHRNFSKAKSRKDSCSASSPRSGRSKSTSESGSESDKKNTQENSEEKSFSNDTAKSQNHRRKINRNISIKSTENSLKIVPKDETNSVKNRSLELRMALEAMEADHKIIEEKHSKEAEVRVIKFTPRKLSLTSLKSSKAEDSNEEQKTGKKRKWGSSTTPLSKASLSISTDSLKTLIPDFKPMTATSVLTEVDELSTSVISEESPPPKKDIKLFNLPFLEEIIEEEMPDETTKSPPPVVETMKEVPHELPEGHQLSPARNPASNILFIRNLVRPFTLLQLKELLKQTGHFSEEGFWIDKIKSKCFVMYDTEEQAVRTRDALHGARWPSSNPKILTVDFATLEELDFHKSVISEPPKITLPPLYGNSERYDSRNIVQEDVHKRKEREERKKEKERQKPTVTYIREWDKDKLTQESPERESKPPEKESDKGPSVEKRKEKKDSKRRQEEDTPAKLLDDLFQKTKTSPCIYWLPLTEEQAKQKEEERSMRQLEREKRWQQREQEVDRRNRFKGRFGREKENRRSQSHSRSRSPVGRRR